MICILRCVTLLALIFAEMCLGVAYAVPEGPAYPSAAWTQREATNFAKVSRAPMEQAANPIFQQRWAAQSTQNQAEWLTRATSDPSWLDPRSGNTEATPVCASGALQCVGDPFRYPGVDSFYQQDGQVKPVVYYDRDCTRLSGHVWRPKNITSGARLPAVIIETGSIEAPEQLYWWAAEALTRDGYVVMTFDVRGQGRSDFQSPTGALGSDFNPKVFWTELVDTIDFFRSTPSQTYPNQSSCVGTYATKTDAFNPYWAVIDPDRLGVAGHSSGGYGVSVVQAYGAPGAEPWPGKRDKTNPVKAVVAWDGLVDPTGFYGGYGQLEQIQLPGYQQIFRVFSGSLAGSLPPVVPRVPVMAQFSEYGAAPEPYVQPPDPDGYLTGFSAWEKAGVPVFAFTIQGSSHYEWSLVPTFPASSWCPQIVNGACSGGWGNPMAQYYTLAWFDRWLKKPGEPGYATADARLLDDAGPQGAHKMSFYYRSARSFPDRNDVWHVCGDIRAGCSDTPQPYKAAKAVDAPNASSQAGGGSFDGWTLIGLGLMGFGLAVTRKRICFQGAKRRLPSAT